MTTSAAQLATAVARGMLSALRRGVTVLEPHEGPWVNQNTFGDQRLQPLPASSGIVVSVLPKNTGLYGPPAVHSVQLGRSDAVDAQNADVYARVTFGCGGVENSFDLDWLHGVQFSLVCNSVSVQAVTYAPAGGAYSAANASVALKAMVAKGSVCQGRCPATFTERSVRLTEVATPGALQTYFVHDFARELTVHVDNNSDPSVPRLVVISMLNQGGTVMAQYDAQVCSGGRSIPIPGGVNTVLVENQTADQVQLTAQWFLGL